MATKNLRTTKKKSTLRAVLRTISLGVRISRALQLVRDLQCALQNTGHSPEGPGDGIEDSDMGGGSDFPDFDFPDFDFFDGFF